MTLTEGDRKPNIETKSHIELPGKLYDPRQLADQGFEHLGVGLVLLRNNPQGAVEVLMGQHRETQRSPEESQRWSWLAETVAETEGGKNISDILARLVTEEMDRGLIDLDLVAGDQVIYETDLMKEGKRFMVPVYVFWTEQDLEGTLRESEEIDQLKFVNVDEIVSRTNAGEYPLREFTIPGLQQLADQGVFAQGELPKKKVTIPDRYTHNGYTLTGKLDLARYRTI